MSRETRHKEVFAGRRARLCGLLAGSGADALLVFHPPNVYYLSGFTGSSGVLLLEQGRSTLFTDGRYSIQAREEVAGIKIEIVRDGLLRAVGERLRRRGGRQRVAFPPSELTVEQKSQLDGLAGRNVQWIRWAHAVEKMRAVKGPVELDCMRAAARIASDALAEVLPLVRPGVTELDLAAEVDYRLRRKGASGPSFDTIVASGPRSAWPHARPSSKPIKKNELVVFDLGAILRRYCSDLTRTVFVGKAPVTVRRWYKAVCEAQEAARNASRPGTLSCAVDGAARRVLERHGFGRNFVHSTGHGLGLEVHECPRLGRGDETPLTAGNVVTIEPGVYIEGSGGVRVEDEVLILENGTELLTTAPKVLLEL